MSSQQDALLRWQRVSALFDQAIDRAADERERFVRAQAGEDRELAAEVLNLLAAADTEDAQALGLVTGGAQTPPSLFAPLPPGTRLGAWRLGELIGRGGMGEVHRAERADGEFEQRAAIKLIAVQQPAAIQRFHAERNVVAALEHPGIARVLDGGTSEDGRPYMVMEYVDGQPVTRYCAQYALNLKARLGLFLQVCEAVGHAHRHLVVHRDLKPGNLLVDGQGQLKLLDFGVAKLLSEAVDQHTMTHAALTPAYAAPEQLSGAAVTTATDVFSLGVLLFELLTGRTPTLQSGNAITDVIEAVLHREAPRASDCVDAASPVPAAQIRGDLDAILARALRREPAARYASVEAMAEDVRAGLEHRPVQARSGSRLYHARRFLRRYAWQSAAAVLLLLTLAGGLAATAWQARQAALERDLALRSVEARRSISAAMVRLFSAVKARAAGQSLDAGDFLDADADFIESEFATQPAVAAQLMSVLGAMLHTMGDAVRSQPLLARAVALGERELPPAELADLRLQYARALAQAGAFEAADRQLRQAEAYWQAQPDRYRPELAAADDAAAQILFGRGEAQAALQRIERALQYQLGAAGEDSPSVAKLRNSKAMAHYHLGDADAAQREQARVWASVQAHGMEDTPHGLTSLSNLGAYAIANDDLQTAQTLLQEAVARQMALFGPSANLALDLTNLGEAQWSLGRQREALASLQRATDMAGEFLAVDEPWYQGIACKQVHMALRLGELSRAQALFDALALDRSAVPANPFAAECRLMHAAWSIMRGDAPTARRDLQAAVEAGVALGVATVYFTLWQAYVLEGLDEPARAAPLYERAVAQDSRAGSAEQLTARRWRAESWLRQGREAEAIEELRSVAAAYRERFGADNAAAAQISAQWL